jgi:hypothetical protein
MPISFRCPDCEKSLRVPDEKQGKRIKCSGCGVVVKVPDEDEELEDEPPSRRSKSPGKAKGKGKRSKAKSSDGAVGMWIGIAGGAVVVVGLAIWLLMPGKAGSTNTAPATAGADGAAAMPPTGTGQTGTPGTSSPPSAADKMKDQNRLKQLTLAMHNYHETHRQLPIVDRPENFGPDGRPLLSWRVHVLPYLSRNDLYQRFHLNEPWDSPHNKTLLDQMPDEFRSGNDPGSNTRMLTLTGPHALFFQRNVGLRDITDGTSNTLMLVQVGPDKAVPWTKPDDVIFDPANPQAGFGAIGASFLVAMADGRVQEIAASIDPQSLAKAVSPRGGDAANLSQFVVTQQPVGIPGANTTPVAPTVSDAVQVQLKRIGLGMHNYHDTYVKFPVADNPLWFDANGRPNLSWRVHLLPYVDELNLYQEFKLNEPWNSPHNSQLIPRIPAIFQSASRQGTKTPFVTMSGPQTPFAGKFGPMMREFTDGSSNTILVIHVADDKMVNWTEPVDLVFDPNNPLAAIGSIPATGIPVVFVDGFAGRIKPTVTTEIFKAMVTPSGGEIVDRSMNLMQ